MKRLSKNFFKFAETKEVPKKWPYLPQMFQRKNNNKGVENAGVTFVEGANERNEFFEKINKQLIYDKQGQGLTISGTN